MMRKTQARWTEEENAVLAEFGCQKSIDELAAMLPGHTKSGISGQRSRLGLTAPPARWWTKEEETILVEFGARRSIDELAAMLPGRTAVAINRHRWKLGAAEGDARWTEEENDVLRRIGGRKLLHELKAMMPDRTARAISIQRKRLGVELSAEYLSRIAVYNRAKLDNDLLCKLDQSLTIDDFDDEVVEILLGSILGDGCIKKNSGGAARFGVRNYLFYEGHGIKQIDYVMWKIRQLAVFLPKLGGRPEMSTVSHPVFTMLRGKFYRPTAGGEKGKKGLVPLDVLDRLGLLGLMVWYLDDGYLGLKKDGTGGGRNLKPRPAITAKLFDYDGLVRLCGQLNERLSLGLYVSRNKWKSETCNVIRFRREDYRRVIPVWRAYAERLGLPECMHYKLNMHDPRLMFIENLNLRTKEGKDALKAWDDARALSYGRTVSSLPGGDSLQVILAKDTERL